MEEADYFIIVTDQITLSDQKLIGKLCRYALRNKKSRDIYIVHNLMKLETKDQVKKYVKNEILKVFDIS
jgi:hypothetical protein